jgi:hypothetical protein
MPADITFMLGSLGCIGRFSAQRIRAIKHQVGLFVGGQVGSGVIHGIEVFCAGDMRLRPALRGVDVEDSDFVLLY